MNIFYLSLIKKIDLDEIKRLQKQTDINSKYAVLKLKKIGQFFKYIHFSKKFFLIFLLKLLYMKNSYKVLSVSKNIRI